MFVRPSTYGFKTGDRVVATKEFSTCAGTFMPPHRFAVIDCGPRGYNLVDDEGHRLLEAGFEGFEREDAYNKRMTERENWR